MEPPEDPELEFWELPNKSEGYDVYAYDPPRAKSGQRLTLLIFVLAIIVFALAIWFSAHPKTKPQPHSDVRVVE